MAKQKELSKEYFDKYSSQLVRIRCGEKDGTGFFIGDSFILTAAHNVIGESITDDTVVEVVRGKKSIEISMDNVLRNVKPLDPDCALLKLSTDQKVEFDSYGFFKLSLENPKKNEVYHTAGFEQGDDSLTSRSPKYVGPFEGVEGKLLYHEFNNKDIPERVDLDRYENIDITGGFSGAPIVNKNLEIIGIVIFDFERKAHGCYSVQLDEIRNFIESLDEGKDAELGSLKETQGLQSKARRQYVKKDGVVQCYVIESSTEEFKQENPALRNVVKSALKKYESSLYNILKKKVETTPRAINIDRIVESSLDLDITIQALCRADIVVFDITNFEPAIMLLLGIRSVVRRGVTIASYGGEYEVGIPIEAPFSIKEVNIISHSKKQTTSIDLIGDKLIAGFEHLVHMPDYLDLPVYDAIRTLPPHKDQRVPKAYYKQILVLCPFSQQYTENNWKDFLKPQLEVEFTSDGMTPTIVRTLDMKSPRLVSQSLYQEMRLTQVCIVDWTNWQPNVFFELGVRLAANDIEPICIIESDDKQKIIKDSLLLKEHNKSIREKESNPEKENYTDKDLALLDFTAFQKGRLLDFFNLFEYKAPKERRIKDKDYDVYSEMLMYHKQMGQSNKKIYNEESLPYGFFYSIISDHIDVAMEISTLTIYDELKRNADLLNDPDIDTEGRSSLLFPNNKLLNTKATNAAIEMRLAAWYYIDNRLSDNLLSNENLFHEFMELGNLLARSLKRSDPARAKQIRSRIKDLEQNIDELKNKDI